MTSPAAPGHIPAGATPEGDGIVVGHGPVRVDAFIDFLCPYCREFELASAPTLAGLVAGGRITHPAVALVKEPLGFDGFGPLESLLHVSASVDVRDAEEPQYWVELISPRSS